MHNYSCKYKILIVILTCIVIKIIGNINEDLIRDMSNAYLRNTASKDMKKVVKKVN